MVEQVDQIEIPVPRTARGAIILNAFRLMNAEGVTVDTTGSKILIQNPDAEFTPMHTGLGTYYHTLIVPYTLISPPAKRLSRRKAVLVYMDAREIE